jgi:hypothetical protein
VRARDVHLSRGNFENKRIAKSEAPGVLSFPLTLTAREVRIGAPREVVVLCPPARMSPSLSPTYNFEVWCEENGERGEKLLEEWADTEKKPSG